jgi:hypothetical protein
VSYPQFSTSERGQDCWEIHAVKRVVLVEGPSQELGKPDMVDQVEENIGNHYMNLRKYLTSNMTEEN